MPVSARTRQDPTDMYLEALKLVTKSAELVEKRDYKGHPPDATGGRKTGRLVKAYPQWRPNLLQTRRQLNRGEAGPVAEAGAAAGRRRFVRPPAWN